MAMHNVVTSLKTNLFTEGGGGEVRGYVMQQCNNNVMGYGLPA